MSLFDDLVHEFTGNLDEEVLKKLIHELEHVAADIAVNKVGDVVGRVLIKGVDGVVAATVKVLDSNLVEEFTHHYVDSMDTLFLKLQDDLRHYIPLQVAVEEAKHKFGSNSAEANVAREARKAGIEAVKNDVHVVFANLIAQHI